MKSHPSSAMPLHSDAPIGGTPIQSDAGPPLSGQHPHPHSDDSSQGPCQAAPRSPRFVWRRAARHHQLRLARQPLLRRLLRLSRRRAAPRCSAPLPSPRASAAATAAWAAFTPPRCSALASPRLAPFQAAPRSPPFAGRRAGQRPRPRFARQLLRRWLGRLSRRLAAPPSPRLAWRRAARHHHLRLARRPPLRVAWATFAPPRCSALSSVYGAPHCSAPSPLPRTSAAASAALAAFAAPRSPRLAWRHAPRHHHLRLARRPPLRRLWRPSCCRTALRSPLPRASASASAALAAFA